MKGRGATLAIMAEGEGEDSKYYDKDSRHHDRDSKHYDKDSKHHDIGFRSFDYDTYDDDNGDVIKSYFNRNKSSIHEYKSSSDIRASDTDDTIRNSVTNIIDDSDVSGSTDSADNNNSNIQKKYVSLSLISRIKVCTQHAHTHTNTDKPTHTQTHIKTHTHTHTHTHTRKHTHTDRHTHTHIHQDDYERTAEQGTESRGVGGEDTHAHTCARAHTHTHTYT
jgi:hypothetical protein